MQFITICVNLKKAKYKQFKQKERELL